MIIIAAYHKNVTEAVCKFGGACTLQDKKA